MLSKESCEACRADAPRVSPSESIELLKEVPEWKLVSIDDVKRLVRMYSFSNFVDALAFANKVGEIAEQVQHHPKIAVEWGKVEVSWWTHKISGLHRNDFIMAARTDDLLDG